MLALLLAALAWALPAPAQAADPLRGLDAYIEGAMRDWEVPGMAVAIVRHDSVIYARGFGVRQLGRPERVDENTVFAVASNTKAVTATALGMLVSEGKLRWSDPATRYLPYLQLHDAWATRELTVKDLLGHHAGYGTWQGDLLWYGSDRTIHDVLTGYRNLEPTSSFRSEYGYNNILFVAGGEIIPAVAGQSWADFVRGRILTPLGMTRTTTSVKQLRGMDNVAQPHTRIDGRVVAVPYRDVDNSAGAAALNSSVRDWAQWLRLQLAAGAYGGRQLVDSAAILQTRAPQTVIAVGAGTRRLFPSTHFQAYGMGWFLRDYAGKLVVYHSGGMDGMLSYTGFVPEAGVAVAVFSNYDEQSLYSALYWEILDRLLGVPSTDRSKAMLALTRQSPEPSPEAGHVAGTRPTAALESFAGTYESPVLGEARVTSEGGKLHLRVVHNPGISGELAHWQYDTFRATWEDRYLGTSLVTFTVDANGRPDTFRMQVRPDFVDPQEYVFRRR